MRTYNGKNITKKHVAQVLRTQDSTKIYRLVHILYGGKVTANAVYKFIEEYAPSERVWNNAYSIAYNSKHRDERIRIEEECIRRHGIFRGDIKTEIVNFLKKQCQNTGSNYAKRPMYGHTHLYFCSPVYGHRDYNKWSAIPIHGNEAFCAAVIRYADKFFAPIYDRTVE